MKKKILIIAAHPDDDVLGCGGLFAKYSKKFDFKVIFLCEGSSCRYKNLKKNELKIRKEIQYRELCAKKSLKLFSIKNISFYNNLCGRLHKVPQIKLNQIIENEIKRFKPSTIFTHSDKDLNSDHKAIFKSVMIATRPKIIKNIVTSIYTFEILSSTEWNFSSNFKPNYFINLNRLQLLKKWKAIKIYKSEIRNKPHPRSLFGVETLAKYRGMQSGNLYAEGFELVRKLKK